MLSPRIIPCLLVSNGGLVKTLGFKSPKYVGDPINAVRIFNEKEADELIMLDIDATRLGKEPDYKQIELWATECRMPLCYGGGIKTVEQAERIFSLGVEKIAISSAAIESPDLVKQLANKVGNQSVVVVFDVKKKVFGGYEVYTHNGTKKVKLKLSDAVKQVISFGAGEIVLNSIDNDGQMNGFDHKLVSEIKPIVSTPLTVIGGAGKLQDISRLIEDFGIIGGSAGSLFVFKGPYRAVLINYPEWKVKSEFIQAALKKYLS
ncbi:MAG: cyclase [Sediminicola sp.]|jgi:cyclase